MNNPIYIYFNGWLHPKNENALKMYKSIKLSNDIDKCSIIYNPSNYMDISKYTNKFFIFGPHFSVFPNNDYIKLLENHDNRAIYIQPSQWAKDVWINALPDKKDIIKVLPFGVDTNRFCETCKVDERQNVFLYFKSRSEIELNQLKFFLYTKKINYKIFSYEQRYNEDEYLQYLQNSKYGIILDRHESQGFALEEAMSCNVPLLVWNVTNMNQEMGQNYPSIPATSIPYWDNRCGEYFYDLNDLEKTFNKFINNLDTYKPREYILENISIEKCEEKLLSLLK